MSEPNHTSTPERRQPHRERLPPRNLVIMYLAAAYLCLALAFTILALSPRAVEGFFYQARMLAVVHLVTLGWITLSILGSFHLIGPVALRTVLRAGKADYVAWALVVIGVAGMVGHFWIGEYNGMVWSAGTLLAGIAWVAGRAIPRVWRAGVQGGVKLHIILAYLNILAAGGLGMLIGLEKQLIHVLPGFMLYSVYAHAHLAALGWATMMVMGTAYRLLPMVLPAAMPEERRTWASAVLVELGLVVLVVGLPAASTPAVRVAALLIVAGLAAFLYQVGWMKRHPKPSPKDLVRPDFGALHAMQALAYLGVAAGLGVALAFGSSGAWKLRVAVVYGVCALLGFLAQMVIGIAARILPIFAWMHYYVASDFEVIPPSQYTMHSRPLQICGFVLWTAGVPGLAYGLAFGVAGVVSAAAAALLVALLCNAANVASIARHAFAHPEKSP